MQITTLKELGRAVRAKRRRDGLTQGELGALTGLSTRFICEVERGKAAADFARLLTLLTALGLGLTVGPRGWPASVAAVPDLARD